MALSLTAEQKEVIEILQVDKQYIIPAYQRPYSWGYDECFQFYTDLTDKFKERDEYFLGNVIIAKSSADKDSLHVIDGQQRLTTLLIVVKILYLFNPSLKKLQYLMQKDDLTGSNELPKLITNVFEENDSEMYTQVMSYDFNMYEVRLEDCSNSKGKISQKKCNSLFEYNALHFFKWFKFYQESGNSLIEFTSYLLRSVYLLPIELTGKTMEEASEKALVIFETINNRGLNLSDADIFKAKLYQKAKNVSEEKKFISQWVEFKQNCQQLSIEVDEIFRYYSHVVRGKRGITSSEINLREFFVLEAYSPFNNLEYQEIIQNLYELVEVVDFISNGLSQDTIISPYMKLLDAYTNKYPKFALAVYLFKNGNRVDDKLIDFCESIVRYFYIQGSTTAVKFETFNIIKNIFSEIGISSYCKDMSFDQLSSLGLLKKGYALLSYYVENSNTTPNLVVDSIIGARDYPLTNMAGEIESPPYKEIQDLLGNYIVLDIRKKYMPLDKKILYYQTSQLESVHSFIGKDITYDHIIKRDEKIKLNILNFFSCHDSIHKIK